MESEINPEHMRGSEAVIDVWANDSTLNQLFRYVPIASRRIEVRREAMLAEHPVYGNLRHLDAGPPLHEKTLEAVQLALHECAATFEMAIYFLHDEMLRNRQIDRESFAWDARAILLQLQTARASRQGGVFVPALRLMYGRIERAWHAEAGTEGGFADTLDGLTRHLSQELERIEAPEVTGTSSRLATFAIRRAQATLDMKRLWEATLSAREAYDAQDELFELFLQSLDQVDLGRVDTVQDGQIDTGEITEQDGP